MYWSNGRLYTQPHGFGKMAHSPMFGVIYNIVGAMEGYTYMQPHGSKLYQWSAQTNYTVYFSMLGALNTIYLVLFSNSL